MDENGRTRWLAPVAVAGSLLVLLGVAVFLLLRVEGPRLTEQEVRDALYTTIQREAPEAFLVTGRLDMTATTRVENSKVFLPGLLGIDLGTVRTRVRVPGSVSYGFSVQSLSPDMFRMLEDGTVEVQMPPLSVYSVEPKLSQLEVETDRGWLRSGATEQQVEQRALAIVEGAFRRQAVSHLRSSYQPRVNTSKALEALLIPVLKGLGMENPKLRFRVGEGVVVERPSG